MPQNVDSKLKTPLISSQPMMARMMTALAPLIVAATYFFGWRVFFMVIVVNAAGLFAEYLTASKRSQPISMACFVTCWLYALSLPPTIPYWQAIVGVVVAVLFGKEVFGGFGRNWANPAIVGRAFVYVAFPRPMTGGFLPTFQGWPGGFAHWSFASLERVPEWLSGVAAKGVDAITQATPNLAARDYCYFTNRLDLFLGRIGGTFQTDSGARVLAAGSVGEGCAFLIIAAMVYLVVTRTANWRLMVGMLAGASLVNSLLGLGGAQRYLPFAQLFFSGSLLYGAAFMVTEPITAPRTSQAKWIYAVAIGMLYVAIRWKGQFAGALSFSILLGNMMSPSLDLAVRAWKARGKTSSPSSEGGAS